MIDDYGQDPTPPYAKLSPVRLRRFRGLIPPDRAPVDVIGVRMGPLLVHKFTVPEIDGPPLRLVIWGAGRTQRAGSENHQHFSAKLSRVSLQVMSPTAADRALAPALSMSSGS